MIRVLRNSFIVFVTLLTVLLCLLFHWIQIACSLCNLPRDKSMLMSLITVTTIRASLNNEYFFVSTLHCQVHCSDNPTCYYMTVNDINKTCSIFRAGMTVYDVSQSRTFVINSKLIEVKMGYACHQVKVNGGHKKTRSICTRTLSVGIECKLALCKSHNIYVYKK